MTAYWSKGKLIEQVVPKAEWERWPDWIAVAQSLGFGVSIYTFKDGDYLLSIYDTEANMIEGEKTYDQRLV